MAKFSNTIGTVLDRFQIGIGGPIIKRVLGVIQFRNAADNGHADIEAALVKVFGDSIELNAGAAGSGADWAMTLSRPDTGMTEDIDVVLPPGPPSPGQVLRVAGYADGVVTLEYATTEAGASNMVLIDETALAFGSGSSEALLTKPANGLIEKVKVIVDTPFNGTPTVSIGVSGTTSKYAAASHIDLTAPAGTIFELDAGEASTVGTEAIIATYSAGGASAGAARIQLIYGIPS